VGRARGSAAVVMVRQRGQDTAEAEAGICRRQLHPMHVTCMRRPAACDTLVIVLQVGHDTTGDVSLHDSVAPHPAFEQRTMAFPVPQKLHAMLVEPCWQMDTLWQPAHATEKLLVEGGGGVLGQALIAPQEGHLTCAAPGECVITCWH